MNPKLWAPPALVLLATFSAASAAPWSAYDRLFPGLPCQDGWAACRVSGAAVTPAPARDAAGHPVPSSWRVGWFDLQPSASFSPFAHLSDYSAAAAPPAAAEAPPVTTDAPPPVAANTQESTPAPAIDSPVKVTPATPSPNTPTTTTPPVATTTPPPATTTPPPVATTAAPPSSTTRTPSSSTTTTPPPAVVTTTSTPSTPTRIPPPPTPTTTTTPPVATTTPPPSPGRFPTATPTTPPPSTLPPPVATPTPTTAVIKPPVLPPPTAAAGDDTCNDLIKLEPSAMMGTLRPGQIRCIEGRISSEGAQTMKDKLSRILINNADGASNKVEWERLVKRHLEDIDQSDPEMCYKYARYLSKQGTGRAQGVIRWGDKALENKQKWSGQNYTTKVYELYKLKAEASNKLWQDAEQKFAGDTHTDEQEAIANKWRGTTRDNAREWLDYARASGQDTKGAMSICVSAAGNKAFCEGG